MRPILLTILSFLTLTALAQETKLTSKRSENPYFLEEFYVLKSDKNIRHGSYKKLGYRKSIMVSGYYKNNQKDSTWTDYFWRTEIIKSQGNYKDGVKNGIWFEYFQIGEKNTLQSKGEHRNGEKIGLWEFYNGKKELVQKYDYDKMELIYFMVNKEENKEHEVKSNTGIEKILLDRPPFYVGGELQLMKAIGNSSITYPPQARDSEISGMVWISCYINENGKATDFKVHKGIGGGCDEEALRAAKEIPNQWIPGQLNGETVVAKYLFPVSFTLR